MSSVLQSAIPEAVRANADRLGLRTLLRPATVEAGGTDTDVVVTFDGDTGVSHVMTLIGPPPAGARVMCLMDPPHGALVVGYLQSPAWTDYTPTLTAVTTNPTLGGDSVAVGSYTQVGKLVTGRASIQFGTAGVAAGSGVYSFGLPVTALASATQAKSVGHGIALDASTSDVWTIEAVIPNGIDTAVCEMYVTSQGVTQVRHDNPFVAVWAESDLIALSFMYEAA